MSNIKVLSKQNDKMKSNFSKLTLSSKKNPCAINIPLVSNVDKRNWEQNLYHNENNTNTEEKSVQNNCLLTDDESDSESEKENILQNKILFSSPSLDKANAELIQNKQQTPLLSQLFSEKLQVSDSEETNFSGEVENVVAKKQIHDWLIKLNKFESSESQCSAKLPCSRNLFSQDTDELEILMKSQMENKTRNHLQSEVNRLSETMENLELTNKNIPNTISNTNNLPSVIESALEVTEKTHTEIQEQKESKVLLSVKKELNNVELESTILTLNSTNCSSERSQNIDKSVILISDSDVSSGEYSRNVSSLNQNDELNSSTLDQLDNFFNNIPSLEEEEIVISSESNENPKLISPIESLVPVVLREKSNICISDSDPEEEINKNEDKEESIQSDKVLEDSYTSANNNNAEEKLSNEPVILSKQNTQESATDREDAPVEAYIEKINISAKIKINLKITECSTDSNTSKSDDNDDNASTSEDIKSTNDNNDVIAAEEKTDTHNESPVAENASNVSHQSDEKTNLDKSIEIIDLGMEKILNEIYGKEWQTPDMVKKCESIRKGTRHQQSTLDNTYMDEFITLHHNRNSILESTRINQLDNEFDLNAKENNDKQLQINDVESPRSTKNTPRDKIRTKLMDKFCENDISSKEKSESPWLSKKTPIEKIDKTTKRIQSITKRGTPGPSKLQTRINSICDPDSSTSSDNDDTKFIIKKPVKKTGANSKQKLMPKLSTSGSSDDERYPSPKKINAIDISTKALKFLDSCEFKKKSILPKHNAKPDAELEINCFKKPSDLFQTPNATLTKRKLYTPCHDIVPDLEDTIEDAESVINVEVPSVKSDVVLKHPLPSWMTIKDKRLESIKSMEMKTPIVKKSNDEKLLTPKSKSKIAYESIDFCITPPNVYGFLRSLDVMVGLQYCHPKALQYRNNYKNNKEELTEILYHLYNENIFDNKLDVPVQWNKKLLNTAGRCNNRRRGQVKSCVIDLSEKVLTSADRLRCTLVHELCHAAAWLIDGATGHGAEWKRWATRANKVFPELPKINVCHQYEIEYKYTYECVDCNARSHAHSKSKKVETIRCSYCHGAIRTLLNKKDKEGNIIRTPTREAAGFAKFVKEKYKTFKNPDLTHAEVMKLLSTEFNSMKMLPE